MDVNRNIREARLSDMADIMTVMDAAKGIMRQSGNMHQWGEGYPSEAVILSDMEKGGGYVVEEDSKIVGYFVLLPVSRHPFQSDPCRFVLLQPQ